jgi:hypothetical protein
MLQDLSSDRIRHGLKPRACHLEKVRLLFALKFTIIKVSYDHTDHQIKNMDGLAMKQYDVISIGTGLQCTL